MCVVLRTSGSSACWSRSRPITASDSCPIAAHDYAAVQDLMHGLLQETAEVKTNGQRHAAPGQGITPAVPA